MKYFFSLKTAGEHLEENNEVAVVLFREPVSYLLPMSVKTAIEQNIFG
jgi:hypothetical protein